MAEGERNAVTWGVFPGQEIVQSTIIERESFLSWKVRPLSPSTSHLTIVLVLIISNDNTGRSFLNMDRLGLALPARIERTGAPGGHSRHALFSQCDAPRL